MCVCVLDIAIFVLKKKKKKNSSTLHVSVSRRNGIVPKSTFSLCSLPTCKPLQFFDSVHVLVSLNCLAFIALVFCLAVDQPHCENHWSLRNPYVVLVFSAFGHKKQKFTLDVLS